MLPDLVDGADIGMVESGGRPRFPLETVQGLRVLREVIGQKFQGDKAAKLYVLRLVDHAHPAAAQFLDDAVVRNGLADHAQGCYGGSIPKSMKAVELGGARPGIR